ncbi:hypothetical protein HLB23_22085 [Nocardia uniformis]|uniref:NACHT domain-containing protein n=1 Tax=Nocardia uniformis TaxID=53432 RepID=A0A849C1M3_9NOCA|nr:hypothetical protein [Nocardia uniformis]NNH72514.1 hypothetical protein [Nocardia uniformis]
MRQIAGYYPSRSGERLLVLGEPGAGKAVTLLSLLLELLADRDRRPTEERGPVPVRVDAATWNPLTRSLTGWLADRIASDHGLRVGVVRRLVESGAILPVLERIDGMDPPGREPVRLRCAIEQLDAAEWHDRALVIGCDADTYQRLRSDGGRLGSATVIELQPIGTQTVLERLNEMRNDPTYDSDTWKPVVWRLVESPDGPLARSLRTPVHFTLAVNFLRRGRPGDIARLVHASSEAEVASVLHSAVLAAAIESTPRVASGTDRYDEGQVHRWLHGLAEYLGARPRVGRIDTVFGRDDIWELIGKRTRILQGVLAALLGFIVLGYAYGIMGTHYACVRTPSGDGLFGLFGWTCTTPAFALDPLLVPMALLCGIVSSAPTWTRQHWSPVASMTARIGATALFAGLVVALAVDIAWWNYRPMESARTLAIGLAVSAIAAAAVAARGWSGSTSRLVQRATRFAATGFVVGLVVALAQASRIAGAGSPIWLHDRVILLAGHGLAGAAGVWPVVAILAALLAFLGPVLEVRFLEPAGEHRWLFQWGRTAWVVLLTALAGFALCYAVVAFTTDRTGLHLALFTAATSAVAVGGGTCAVRRIRYTCACLLLLGGDRFSPRPAVFLEWAHRAGLLRAAGGNYQFSDESFRRWLLANPTPPRNHDHDDSSELELAGA